MSISLDPSKYFKVYVVSTKEQSIDTTDQGQENQRRYVNNIGKQKKNCNKTSNKCSKKEE